jgi:hypothetical protein
MWIVVGSVLKRSAAINSGAPSTAAFAIAAVMVIPTVMAANTENQNRKYLHIAQTIAAGSSDVTLKCQTLSLAMFDADDHLGTASSDKDGNFSRISLDREICQNIRIFEAAVSKSKATGNELMYTVPVGQVSTFPGHGVHVLTHEGIHAYGIHNEAATECYAMQNDAFTAMMLGSTREEGERLAAAYWEYMYPRMPEEYYSQDCADSGPYDLNPNDKGWPTADSQLRFKLPALEDK